jgi:hypothetical protein
VPLITDAAEESIITLISLFLFFIFLTWNNSWPLK